MQIRVSALRSVLSFLLGVVVAVVGVVSASSAPAQISRSTESISISPEALPSSALSNVLEKGLELERELRWGDALSHYEDALREHPGSGEIRQRQDFAKLNYSLDRRYDDRSFRESVQALSAPQAMALYAELLRKIDAHYVESPPWRKLAARSVTAVHLALEDPEFSQANGLRLARRQVTAVQQELLRLAAQRRVMSANDLSALAGDAGRLVERRLGIRQAAVALEFTAAAAGGLDDYSSFLTADQLRDVYSQIEGNFVGLGVELKADSGALLIVHVIPGSPAERAGIRDGDRITAVDGRPTNDLSTDQAAALLTGQEGTHVEVTVVTPGKQARVATVRREQVEVPSLEDVEIIDRDYGVAYVRLPAFQKTTARDLEATLWDLHRRGMRSLILDLRGNPGGLLTAAVEVADKFLMQGRIVSTRGRSPHEDFNYQSHYGGTWRVPLVVLIDRDSASASEIFAGAIKDNARGDVIGERSFGKGSVQGIFPLGYAGAGIRLTTALFYSPTDRKISKQGVEPTQTVYVAARQSTSEATTLTIVDDDDVILRAGVEAARKLVAARSPR